MTSISGARSTRPTADTTTSTPRLSAIVDQRGAPGPVLDHRHLGDVVELDRGAEHRPHRRQHAELHAGRAAGGHDARQGRLVELRARRASRARCRPRPRDTRRSSLLSSSSLGSRCGAVAVAVPPSARVLASTQVVAGLERELARDRVGQLAACPSTSARSGGTRPRQIAAGGGAEQERAGQRGEVDARRRPRASASRPAAPG